MMTNHKPQLIISCVSGFTQSAAHQNGTLEMAAEAIAIGAQAGVDIRVDYLTWDDSMAGAAWFSHRMFPDVPHVVWGYSLGGEAAAKLANHLVDLGEVVSGLVIVDGVVSGWWRPWRWITGKIRVDAGVHNVVSYIQRQDKPDGDVVLWGNVRIRQTQLPINHGRIDEHIAPQATFALLIKGLIGVAVTA